MAKKKKISWIKQNCWDWFSKYIRLKYADGDGYVKCVTCGMSAPWKELQAGHVLDGRCNSILFEEMIVFPQCYYCNVCRNGNKEKYIPWFIDKFSRKIYDEMITQKTQVVKYDYEDLKEMRDVYKGVALQLADRIGAIIL